MMLDQSILKALSGDGATLTWLRFYCLKRNGCLLLALPENKKLARLILNEIMDHGPAVKFPDIGTNEVQ